MNYRAWVGALLFALICIAPRPTFAASCGSNVVTNEYGYNIFSTQATSSYSEAGLLEFHFHNNAAGASFSFSTMFNDDDCQLFTDYPNHLSWLPKISLPPGVKDWSVRFTTPTHFDVWDDQNKQVLYSENIPAYPSYTRVSFFASWSIYNFGTTFTSRAEQIQKDGVAPVRATTLPNTSGCTPYTEFGVYFFDQDVDGDNYERAEYVDGLLRVHMRLQTIKTYLLAGQSFDAGVYPVPGGSPCTFSYPMPSPSPYPSKPTTLPPYIRYFSFRMTSPTHWVMWDDENDRQISCSHCEGDVTPDPTGLVAFAAVRNGTVRATVRTTPFLAVDPNYHPYCTPGQDPNCNSNVLFLPGTEASRLYRTDAIDPSGEVRLWEPDGDALAADLRVNDDGTSAFHVYTKVNGIIDNAYVPLKGDIYKSFISDMNTLASTSKINAWKQGPYDWRFSLEQILSSGKRAGDTISYLDATSTPYIIQELKQLARTSRTGKVTIVAHSNGGLVAKAMMQRLGPDVTADLIDKVILVASPQVGTPQAVAAFLHGDDQGLPFKYFPNKLSPGVARALMRTMPGPYLLLPSAGYFTQVDDPVIAIDSASLPGWAAQYGTIVHSVERLGSFMNDEDRVQPESSDPLTVPAITKDSLFNAAQNVHAVLDTWMPPEGVQLIQIAGWGIPTTVKGIEYASKSNEFCSAMCDEAFTLTASTTIDGDGTVVVPSALWATTSANVANYWVDLDSYNFDHRFGSASLGLTPFKHANILEVNEFRRFVTDTLSGTPNSIASYTYLSTDAPASTHNRLRYALHSPLTLDLYDDAGRHTGVNSTTGEIEEEIPGAYYMEFGDVKYLFADADSPAHIVMQGYANGTFTFNIDELQGDSVVEKTTFKDIPTTSDTNVTMDVESDITTLSPLRLDTDGDGTPDFALDPILGGVVTMPLPLTVTPSNATITLGGAIPPLTASFSGFKEGETATSSDIMGTPECATNATSQSPVGSYPITCTIGTLTSNDYYFKAFNTGILRIVYGWDGFSQPINDTAHQAGQTMSVFKAGSTIPVKFQIKDVRGTPVQASTTPVWLAPQQGALMSALIDESVYSDPAFTGSVFKWDPTARQYVYNWSTRGLASGHWYKLSTQLDDGTTKTVMVGLK